ncbi:MAG: porin family protein [Methylococcaceae bacterium]|nr:porin family protein [Methylococcaceae bacterium]
MAGALVSPQAMARSSSTAAERLAQAANNKADALEAQLQALQAEVISLREQAGRPAASADSEKVQELDAWMTSVKSAPAPSKKHDNAIFFRGGFASNDSSRDGVSIYSDVAGSQLGLPGGQADKDAWYIGAGFDFGLTDDVWGMLDKTEVIAELMFEYKEFANDIQGNVLATNPTPLAAPGGSARTVTVNQLTLTAAPKIKFLKGSAFRPWVIPVGLGLHVVSPPSESITVLNPGIMFGAGADYRVWKDIFVGVDGRYHLTGGAADGVNTDGFTAGGYLGIGF